MGLRPSGNSVTYATTDGDEVQVEIEPTSDGFMPIHDDRPLGRLESLFTPVFLAVGTLIKDARRVDPDAVSIRFGVKLTGGGKAIVARNAADGNFEISLSWNKSDSSAASDLRS